MGIFNRRRAKPRDKPQETVDARLDMMNVRASDWCANRSESICAAAARMANTLACAPMHLYQREAVQQKHQLERLINFSPAPGWNAFTFKRDMEFTRSSVGRAYSWILRDDLRMPTEIQPLSTACTSVPSGARSGGAGKPRLCMSRLPSGCVSRR